MKNKFDFGITQIITIIIPLLAIAWTAKNDLENNAFQEKQLIVNVEIQNKLIELEKRKINEGKNLQKQIDKIILQLQEGSQRANFYSAIIDNNFFNLTKTLNHRKILNFEIKNMSEITQAYSVKIYSRGFGIYFTEGYPKKMIYFLDITTGNVIVSKNQLFAEGFQIIFPKNLSKKGSLEIFVNSKSIFKREYIVDLKKNEYQAIN